MRRCPFCSEQIQDDAIKCKHCKEWLNKQTTSYQHTQETATSAALLHQKRESQSKLPDILLFALFLLSLIFVFRPAQYWAYTLGLAMGLCLVPLIPWITFHITTKKSNVWRNISIGVTSLFLILEVLAILQHRKEMRITESTPTTKTEIPSNQEGLPRMGNGIPANNADKYLEELGIITQEPTTQSKGDQYLQELGIDTTPMPEQPHTDINEQERQHFEAIKAAHPDFDEIIRKGYLKHWIQQQTDGIRQRYEKIYREGTAQEVINMITEYKRAMQTRSNNLRTDGAPSSGVIYKYVDQNGGELYSDWPK